MLNFLLWLSISHGPVYSSTPKTKQILNLYFNYIIVEPAKMAQELRALVVGQNT